MKALILAIAASALVAGAAGSSVAQGYDHNDHHDQAGAQGQHPGWGQDYNGGHTWRQGEHMGYNDWNGAQRVDYRARHLRRPPYGYEWRESNGNYILAAVATGVIASIIINGGR